MDDNGPRDGELPNKIFVLCFSGVVSIHSILPALGNNALTIYKYRQEKMLLACHRIGHILMHYNKLYFCMETSGKDMTL